VDDYCMVITTLDDRDAAASLARSAVEERLAACAQLAGPVESIYRWHGSVETATEWQVWFKTTASRYAALAERIAADHPYDVPEILRVPIAAGHPPYLAWIDEQTTPDVPPGNP
jgi:periplasmic divalent cation tolerance protein